jgi:polyisoprenyl-phosphate glycosyltransferase
MFDPSLVTSTCWIVSPLLRDTESFIRLHAETADECAKAGFECPIRHLVVDDSAGTDEDVQRLANLDGVEVLTPPFNLGHQRAIVYGLRYLAPWLDRDSLIVTMDSDGEDQPSDVPRLLSALGDRTVSLALAQRTRRSESLRFRTMYIVYRFVFRLLTGTTVRSGNFAVQRADSLAATIHHPNFDLCYSSTLLALSRPTVAVPCARGERFAGQSRMNTYSLMAHGIRMLLPFSERIAVRMLFIALTSSAVLLPFLFLVGAGIFGDSLGPAIFSALAALVVVFVTSFAAFVILFSGFSQASAVAMKGIGVPQPPVSLKEDNR